jgi:cysteinyl-tRNA synthetase
MVLKIYNTLTKRKEEFEPLAKTIGMYVCGMTVYAEPHIGHARTYVAFEIIKRYLEYKGYKVRYVQNITDVDDKIIRRANELGLNPLEFAKQCTERCFKDLDELGIDRADFYPKATEHIHDIFELIKKIIAKGYGYVADGDIYFSVKKSKDYGKLSGQKLAQIKKGARILPTERKREAEDFALWKKAKPGEIYWESPWGKGRPGWHIECSAMSMKYLGEQFDLHGGGQDLIFPHHENEIAQSESATGKKPFVKYWLHTGFLTVNKEKMSKSLGNIIPVRDLLKSFNPEVIRFFYTQTHYRSPIDFSYRALEKAKRSIERIHVVKEKMEYSLSFAFKREELLPQEEGFLRKIKAIENGFKEAMDDDFNTSKAMAWFFELVNETNRFLQKIKVPSQVVIKEALDTLVKLGKVLTLFKKEKEVLKAEVIQALKQLLIEHKKSIKSERLEEIMEEIVSIRQAARERKDWAKADKIRSKLKQLGFKLEDIEERTRWRRI